MSAKNINLLEDLHFHSTFSDGKNTVEENIEAAFNRGLNVVCCVDHVRQDTTWVPHYADYVHQFRRKKDEELKKKFGAEKPDFNILIGVEAKFLDATGTLDIPTLPDGVDLIFAADHQFPFGNRIYKPEEIKRMLQANEVTPHILFRHLIRATIGAMWKYRGRVVIAHMFSILPKVGLNEADISLELMAGLARAAVETGTPIEISERWKCPSMYWAKFLHDMGVELRASTDAHVKENIGDYRYVRDVNNYLDASLPFMP